MSKIVIHNTETGEIIERDMTPVELAQQQKDIETVQQIEAEKAVAEAKRQALLNKLGITEEEAKLLLS
jgi:hypothetical protein